MHDFEYDDRELSLAQTCKRFVSNKKSNKFTAYHENLSCRLCTNWNGKKCVTNTYNNTSESFEQY